MRSSPEELVKLGNLTDSVWLSIVPLSSKNNENGDLFKKDGQSMVILVHSTRPQSLADDKEAFDNIMADFKDTLTTRKATYFLPFFIGGNFCDFFIASVGH